MLTHSRIRNRCILSGFTLMSRGIFLRLNLISNKFWNMLSNSILQSLGCSTYVHTIAVAQIFVSNITLLIAMGSSLGHALANVFAEFYERLLFENISKPLVYSNTLMTLLPFSVMKRMHSIYSKTRFSTFIFGFY